MEVGQIQNSRNNARRLVDGMWLLDDLRRRSHDLKQHPIASDFWNDSLYCPFPSCAQWWSIA